MFPLPPTVQNGPNILDMSAASLRSRNQPTQSPTQPGQISAVNKEASVPFYTINNSSNQPDDRQEHLNIRLIGTKTTETTAAAD